MATDPTKSGVTFMKDASPEKVKEMIRTSSRHHVTKMSADLQNATNTEGVMKVTAEMIEKIRVSSKLAAVSVGNYHDLKDHGDTFGLKIEVINSISEWMDNNILDWNFMDIMAKHNSAEDQLEASNIGHTHARAMRSTFAPNTNKTVVQNITVNPDMIGLAREFWKAIKNTGTTGQVNNGDKKYSSLVTELQDHIAIHGNLNTYPPVCWAKGLDGEYIMSKFLAAKEKWISKARVAELELTMGKDDPDTFKKIKSNSLKVQIGAKDDLSGFKKNAMTMDYGCLFWFTMKRAGLTPNEMALVLLSTNEMSVTCNSDKKCMKWLRMRAEGGGKKKS